MMDRREFLKKSLEGIVIGSVPLIYNCGKNPVNSELYIKDNIEYCIQTGKSAYKLGEKVEILYRVANVGKEPYVFSFPSSQWYDFNVKKLDEEIWEWSYNKLFATVITNFGLNPGEYKEFIENWNMLYNNGYQIKTGNYFISGTLGSFRIYPNSTISVDINIIP